MHEGWMHGVVRAMRSMLDPIAALRLAALRRGRVSKTLLGEKKGREGGRGWGRVSAMRFFLHNTIIGHTKFERLQKVKSMGCCGVRLQR